MKTMPRVFSASLAAFVVLACASASAEEKALAVYNWSDYIGKDTIAKFEAETGIKVTYDVYDSNEMLEAKLLSGKTGYDIVVPTGGFLERQAKAGVYRTLDKAKLANWGNLDPGIMKRAAQHDPNNAHAVVYTWGTNGIGYNPAKVKAALGEGAPLNSWALLFDEKNISKLSACGVYFLDAPSEVFPSVLAYLGLDPNSQAPGDIAKAEAVLAKVRPYVSKFHSSEYINALANGDACVAMGFSGDVLQARNRAEEAKNGVSVAFSIPQEGAEIWFDMMAIPKDAPHPENALKFIDFILRPEVMADISNTVWYANANVRGQALQSEELRNDPGVYPPPETMEKLFPRKNPDQKTERLLTRTWNKLKTGK